MGRPPLELSYCRVCDSSIWRLVRCVPVAVEIRVRRVNWWCGIARDLRTRCHITATMFGTFSFDKRADIMDGNTDPTLSRVAVVDTAVERHTGNQAPSG